MTQDLIERTVRDWVLSNPSLGARDLGRLASPAALDAVASAEDIADALIRLAGRLEIERTRVW